MFNSDGILGRDFRIITAGMDGLAMRQQVHAENVGNIDTEGYRAKTVDFESVLKHALKGGDAEAATGSGSLRDAAAGTTNLSSQFTSTQRQGAEAGVSRTTEVSQMMNDSIRFRVLSQQVTNRLTELRNVISEMGRG